MRIAKIAIIAGIAEIEKSNPAPSWSGLKKGEGLRLIHERSKPVAKSGAELEVVGYARGSAGKYDGWVTTTDDGGRGLLFQEDQSVAEIPAEQPMGCGIELHHAAEVEGPLCQPCKPCITLERIKIQCGRTKRVAAGKETRPDFAENSKALASYAGLGSKKAAYSLEVSRGQIVECGIEREMAPEIHTAFYACPHRRELTTNCHEIAAGFKASGGLLGRNHRSKEQGEENQACQYTRTK